MTAEELIEHTIKELVDVPHDIKPEHLLREDLGLDSLDKVELVMTMEKATGFEATNEEFEDIATVGDLIKLTKEKIAEKEKA